MDTTVRILAGCTVLQVVVAALTVTMAACLTWHAWLSVSHLSSSGNVQCRLERRRHRQRSIQLQRQLLAAVFLCGMTNAHAMEGQTQPGMQEAIYQQAQPGIQEALYQLMTSMAEAATRAAAAAEEALKRSSSGGGSSNDGLQAASRILKSPDTFSGDDVMQFQQWKHQFTSWLCFGDNRYSDILTILEKKAEAPQWSTYNADERCPRSSMQCLHHICVEDVPTW